MLLYTVDGDVWKDRISGTSDGFESGDAAVWN
jgi:hypothetical protein